VPPPSTAAQSSSPSPSPSPSQAPSPAALWLGRAGLLPFVAGAVVLWASSGDARVAWATALLAYAALIVSFLGGIHWGLAMRQATPSARGLAWGVVPSLLAWPMLLLPPAYGLAGLGLALWACYAVDRRAFPAQGIGAWLGLRLQLTVVASLSCGLAAAAIVR
jgi:Protein of unknown function (DUF3429)